jgi:SAM-dependent methyltransferase
LPFKDEIFDKASLFDVIEHIPMEGDMTAFSEANRILNKNGILVVTVPNKGFLNICQYTDWGYYWHNHRHYSEKELTFLLKKSGFSVVSICICCNVMPMILVLYMRLFLALLNKIFHTEIELKVLDRIENRICKSNQKLKSGYSFGYSLMIKARKSSGIK